ncbi:hypothetical protein IJ579_01780 [bacterium]|nr:hypothetical protein [bacterium]
MVFAIVVLIVILAVLLVLKFTKFDLKIVGFVFAIIFVCSTIGICVTKPVMHKPFSINIIEYLIKINTDGSVTTTKQTTTTVLEDKVQK